MYKYALIPGRHQALTSFQAEYLSALRRGDGSGVGFAQADMVSPDIEFVWAVTSANHGGTQRNPITGERRLGMIESFATQTNLPSHVYLITNMQPKQDFAHFVVEEIRTASKGRLDLTPENCLVVCSTPAVMAMYRALGFTIADAELIESTGQPRGVRPWDVVESLIAAGNSWRSDRSVTSGLHPSCLAYYDRYGLGDQILEIFSDPLIGSDDGDITDTRDYETYRQAFEDGAARKVADFIDHVKPGRILDVGCATGQTLKLLSREEKLFESDFYGVEVARPLYQLCEQRKQAGEFGQANVYFYQRNIMQQKLFKPGSLDTIITMALTHEIESYLGRHELKKFVARMYDMLAPGGTYINYDVVGPYDKDQLVLVQFTETDGENPRDVFEVADKIDFSAWLKSLSSKARFERFARDFRSAEGDGITYTVREVDGKSYYEMRRADLCDYLAKKDYTDSWNSEMHERFCFFDHTEWVELLENAGFRVENPSRAVQNQWLIENRFAPAANVYAMQSDGVLLTDAAPVTNTLLIATKT